MKEPATVEPTHPNVVYFQVDNLGYGELGCYGGSLLRTSTSRLTATSSSRVRSQAPITDALFMAIRIACRAG